MNVLRRLWCALLRHQPATVLERVGEWTIRECPRCGEWWAEPSTWWLLCQAVQRQGRVLTHMEAELLRRHAQQLDERLGKHAPLDNGPRRT